MWHQHSRLILKLFQFPSDIEFLLMNTKSQWCHLQWDSLIG